jgi:hypothetical protein
VTEAQIYLHQSGTAQPPVKRHEGLGLSRSLSREVFQELMKEALAFKRENVKLLDGSGR